MEESRPVASPLICNLRHRTHPRSLPLLTSAYLPRQRVTPHPTLPLPTPAWTANESRDRTKRRFQCTLLRVLAVSYGRNCDSTLWRWSWSRLDSSLMCCEYNYGSTHVRLLPVSTTAGLHPHLLYGIEVYASSSQNHLNKLIILNNKLLRIQNKSLRTPVIELYRNLIHYLYHSYIDFSYFV